MSSILSPGTKKMNKENKLVPGLPSGFEDRWDKKLLLKKKLLNAIENNFIKFGAEALDYFEQQIVLMDWINHIEG